MPADTSPAKKDDKVFSKAERDAVLDTARERKAAAGRTPEQERADGLKDLKAALAKMPADDRAMGERVHALISAAVPDLVPKTYYGMPAYSTAGKNGKVIGFFKPKSKFRVRYSTFGFQPDAMLDDGDMWPTEFAVIKLTPAVEKHLVELVKRAAS